jgi:hypothetical protein
MKTTLIQIALCMVCLGFCFKSNAHFIDLKGITVQASTELYMQDGEIKSETVDQIYNVSFKDGILMHNIFKDGSISDSQVYQLKDVKATVDGDDTKFTFGAMSGVSGNVYKYTLTIDKDGRLISLVVAQPTGEKTTYNGGASTLKTFKQS